MKSFFVILGAIGLIALIGLGTYLFWGVSVDSQEVVKEIRVERHA